MASFVIGSSKLCVSYTHLLKVRTSANLYSAYRILNYKFKSIKTAEITNQTILQSHFSNTMGNKSEQIVTYQEMKKFENNDCVLIIDVREPDEILRSGKIDGSINMPVSCIDHLSNLSDHAFKEKYGKQKPDRNFPLIFMCKMGIRASKAAGLAKNLGYKNVKIYKGSWDDWNQKEKKGRTDES